MISKHDCNQMQIFINLSNTRGLLWPSIVEGILFDENGFPRYEKNSNKIDKNSLINKLKYLNTRKITNYIIIIDYLVDYLKNEFRLTDIEISTLLKDYLSSSSTNLQLENIKFDNSSWIIPLNIVMKDNSNLFDEITLKIINWLTKSKLKNIDIEENKDEIRKLFSLYGRNNNSYKKIFKEKKNPSTSS